MDKSRKNIKKIVIPNRLIVVAAGKADSLIIFKSLKAKRDEHYTLVIKQNGYVELHLTKEKPHKKHDTLAQGQVNIEKLKSEAEKIYRRVIKPIQKSDQRYRDFLVLIPKCMELLIDFYQRSFIEEDRFIYPSKDKEEMLEKEMKKHFDMVYFDELKSIKIKFAFALSSRNHLYYLLMEKGSCYLFPMTKAANVFWNSIEWKERAK